jgi:hypothetical protein
MRSIVTDHTPVAQWPPYPSRLAPFAAAGASTPNRVLAGFMANLATRWRPISFSNADFTIAYGGDAGYTKSAAQAEFSKWTKANAAGWRSVAGGSPINIPPSPMRNDADAFMVGFSRGKRDADAMVIR